MNQNYRSAFTLIEIMIVVALIGLLAGIAIPSFVRCRSTSQQTACISNLKEIDYAIAEWAVEHKRNGNSRVRFEDIRPYLKGDVVCPAGGRSFDDSYVISTVSQPPMCLRVPTTHVWFGSAGQENAGVQGASASAQ
jgi:prepilin-type N-terminal cleavage/methylation domain-containing protein